MKRGAPKTTPGKKHKENLIQIRADGKIEINRTYLKYPKYDVQKPGEKSFQVYSPKSLPALQEKYHGHTIRLMANG